jgi:hypothetical protein
MAMQALYRGGSRKKTNYYQLPITSHSELTKPKGVYVSRTLFNALLAQSSDLVVKTDHIRVGREEVTPLLINLRRSSDRPSNSNNPLFVSDVDLAKLANHFGVTVEAFGGFFFELKPGTNSNSKNIMIKPVWSELLNPAWRDSFKAWVAGQGSIPTPSRITWSPYGKAFLPMPVSGQMLNFSHAQKEIADSWLCLSTEGTEKIGHFKYKIGSLLHTRTILFTPGTASYFTGQGKITAGENFSSERFTALFGSRKKSQAGEIEEYTFSKRAGREGMPLGNVGGDHFRIVNTRIFNFGSDLFSFRFKRTGDKVAVEVMNPKKNQEVIAAGQLNLDPTCGLPFGNSMSISVNLLGIEQRIPKDTKIVNPKLYKEFLSLLLRVYASGYSSIIISTKQQDDQSFLAIEINIAGETYRIEAKHPNNMAAKMNELGIKKVVFKSRPEQHEIDKLLKSIFQLNGVIDASPDIDIHTENGNGHHPLWKSSLFGLLFGKKPTKDEYTFLKMGGKQGILLGKIGHHRSPFIVSGYKFKAGTPYLFRASREGNVFILEVLDLNTKEEVAEGFVELNEAGFPINRKINLEAFED